ncbi:MAG: Pantothenate synthetase [Phycisphaerae bacterium]|nr:Pantothenate synthetase [Phycisphaerae bacterium]
MPECAARPFDFRRPCAFNTCVLVARSIAEIRRAVSAARPPHRVGLVPTMGALHAGHLSLVDTCRRRGEYCVASIFVNPTQFGPNEDFASYPRDEAGDLEKFRAAGVDAVFMPGVAELYPPGATTTIHVARLDEHLCGPFRPGHFDGVATVVAKLLSIVAPDSAYFGQKDAQQLAIVRAMVRDLDLPVEIVGCPIVREPDGLAMSSRNAYLSPEERGRAVCLFHALQRARDAIRAGQRDARAVEALLRDAVQAARPDRIDYLSVVDAVTLQPVQHVAGVILLAGALHVGRTRLIDNLLLDADNPAAESPAPSRSGDRSLA